MSDGGVTKIAGGWMAGAALAMLAAGWPPPAPVPAAGSTVLSGGEPLAARAVAPAPMRKVIRQIVDPFSGDRWLLLRDPSCPGGPGRLVLAEQGMGGQDGNANAHGHRRDSVLVIHAGDALIVDEHTAAVDARLEAVALGGAFEGETLNARLTIGGKVVRVVAESRGRAALAQDSEGQP